MRSGARALGAIVCAAVLLASALAVRSQPGTVHGLTEITLTPSHVRASVGHTQYLTATGRFADGSYRNVTQRVEYRSSAPTVVAVRNARRQKSLLELVGIGRATISAVDPLTGVTSTDSGGDATVRVGGALERITMKPGDVERAIGESQQFTVTGHYAGGVTVNVTQKARYRSSDPTVALAPNRRGDRSRVEAVAPGTATISAVHPRSGLSTDVSGTNATFTVLGALEAITLAPAHPRCALGEVQHYTATGHYAGGDTRNLTQQVEYATSDPLVATAPNASGSRSRIETVAPGTVTITARDPATGISTTAGGGDARLTVYDPAATPQPAPTATTRPRTSS